MERAQRSAAQLFFLFLAGASAGWLVGLSASEVLAPVLGALVGAAAGLVAGVKTRQADALADPRPVAVLLLGIALLAPVGVLVRTHRLLEPDRQPDGPALATEVGERARTGALFTLAAEQCARLIGSPAGHFRAALQTSPLPWAPLIEQSVGRDATLREIVEALCTEPHSD